MGTYSINTHYFWKYTVKIKHKKNQPCKNTVRINCMTIESSQIQVGGCCIKLFLKNLWNWESHIPQAAV